MTVSAITFVENLSVVFTSFFPPPALPGSGSLGSTTSQLSSQPS
jgi:hypothetical protein